MMGSGVQGEGPGSKSVSQVDAYMQGRGDAGAGGWAVEHLDFRQRYTGTLSRA